MVEKVENTSIQVSKVTMRDLKGLKLRNTESYEDVIQRLIREAAFTEKLLKDKFENKQTIDKFARVIVERLKDQGVRFIT